MTAVIIPFPRHRAQSDGFSPDDIAELHRWAMFVRPRGLRLLTALDRESLSESVVAQLSDGTQFASRGGKLRHRSLSPAVDPQTLVRRGKVFSALRDALECISPTIVVRSPSAE